MERKQLIKLIENKGTSSKEETAELWDIVRAYPYFQTARLLLVKSFHKQGSIHFHNELKVAAAYAPDRKVLFHLINDDAINQNPVEENNVFAIEQMQPVEETPVFEIREEAPTFAENSIEITAPEIKYREEPAVQREEVIEERKNISPPPSSFDEPATTNEEIIRRRLSEILSKNKPEQQEIIAKQDSPKVEVPISKVEDAFKEEVNVQTELPVTHSILDELPSEPADEIEGLEIESIIEENYLQELEKLPEIAPPAPQRGENALNEVSRLHPPLGGRGAEEFSFIDWLKQENSKETTLEEVVDEETTLHQTSHPAVSHPSGGRGASELINKFIETKPRIAPVKAEFYSPANMAKQSITDNGDIISETLARIYFEQANYLKARSCYEKLTLLYPEKSAFFAPLIEKIDQLIRNQP